MKKKTFKIINLLAICGFFVSLISIPFVSNNSEAKEVSATVKTNEGLFKMITDLSTLRDDDYIILANDRDEGKAAVSGINNDDKELTYDVIDDDDSYLSDDGLFVVRECHADIFQIQKDAANEMSMFGVTQDDNNPESLRSQFFAVDDDYGNIIPVSMANREDRCVWIFNSTSEAGLFSVQNKARKHIYLGNGDDGRFDGVLKDYAIWFRVYKKISYSQLESITVENNPTHLNYYSGEDKSLDGLVVNYKTKWDGEFKVKYDDAPQLFEIQSITNSKITFGVADGRMFRSTTTLEVEVTTSANPNHTFTKINSTSLADYRSSYLFVYDKGDGTGYVFDNTLGDLNGDGDGYLNDDVVTLNNLNKTKNYYEVTITDGKISGLDSYHDKHLMTVTKKSYLNKNYYYIGMGTPSSYMKAFTDEIDIATATTMNQATFFSDGHTVTVNGNRRIMYNETSDKFVATTNTTNCHEISLFKLDVCSSIENELESFRTVFVDNTASCDPTGQENRLTSSNWDAIRDAFNGLSMDAQGYLVNLTYEHGKETKDSLKDIVDRYDYIISKYNTFGDFMLRKEAGTHQEPSSSRVMRYNASNVNYTPIIVVVSIISLTSILSLVVIKNRKQK